MPRLVIRLLLLAALAGGLAPPAAAQPSEAAIGAVRSACRGDYIAHCMGVPRGGQEALDCLQRNGPSLSTGCRHALAELGPGLTQQCAAHIRALCPGVTPGTGGVVACLADRRETLADACREALEAARAPR